MEKVGGKEGRKRLCWEGVGLGIRRSGLKSQLC